MSTTKTEKVKKGAMYMAKSLLFIPAAESAISTGVEAVQRIKALRESGDKLGSYSNFRAMVEGHILIETEKRVISMCKEKGWDIGVVLSDPAHTGNAAAGQIADKVIIEAGENIDPFAVKQQQLAFIAGLSSIIIFVTATLWLLAGHPYALFAAPLSGVAYVIGLRYAFRSANFRDKTFYSKKEFYQKFGRVQWMLIS